MCVLYINIHIDIYRFKKEHYVSKRGLPGQRHASHINNDDKEYTKYFYVTFY